MDRKKRIQGIIMLLIVTMIWGSGFIATEYAIRSEMPTAWIMAIRFCVGALLIGACFSRRIFPLSRSALLPGICAGIILFASFYTQTAGQSRTNVSNAAFLTATNVVMIPFLLWLFTRKRPRLKHFLLCGVTMIGVVLLSLDADFHFSFGAGDALVLLCALLFALHIVWLGIKCEAYDPVQVAFLQLLTAGLCGIGSVLLFRIPLSGAQLAEGILPVLYLGIFSTGVCYLLQTIAQKNVPATEAGIVLSAEGAFGTLFSLLLGLESLRWGMLVGGVLITLSIILAEYGEAE